MTLVTLAASLRSIGAGTTRVGMGGVFACARLLMLKRLARNDAQPPFGRDVGEIPRQARRTVVNLFLAFADGLECSIYETTHD